MGDDGRCPCYAFRSRTSQCRGCLGAQLRVAGFLLQQRRTLRPPVFGLFGAAVQFLQRLDGTQGEQGWCCGLGGLFLGGELVGLRELERDCGL